MKNIGLLLAALLLLSSCASYQMTMMPRDSGKVYAGVMKGNGNGVGTITVTIDDVTYTGPVVRVASNDTFGFATTYGVNNRGGAASSIGSFFAEGDKFAKALLSGANGHGLRCDLVGRGQSGGGICVDDGGKIYDVVLVSG